MTYTITATAPTVYQLNSLRAFGMGFQKNITGSFSARMTFETEDEAKEYLRQRADLYNDQDPEGSDKRLAEMYAEIDCGALNLDAVTAYIEAE